MGYIPQDAKWYIAEIIVEIKIENEPRNVVQTNIILIYADSPEAAYKNAIELGKEHEMVYENSENNFVTIKFRGLRDLNVIHDPLEHGGELIFKENIAMTEDEIQSMISPREKLGIFSNNECPANKPNYLSKEILKKILDKLDPRDKTNK
ncbi:MAG: DUF4288 domain-containing protein [Bacteroidota bacterium]